MVYRGHSLLHRVLANCQDDLERRVCGIKPEEHDDYDDTYETKANCEDDYQKDACSGIGLSMR